MWGKRVTLKIGPKGQKGYEFTERFSIDFKVTKSRERSANKGEFSIYGLSTETSNAISIPGHIVVCEAGYDDESISIVSIMEVTECKRELDGSILKTTLICDDGFTETRRKKVSLSYKTGVPYQKVIDDIARQAGLAQRSTSTRVAGSFDSGVSFSGRTADVLSKVAKIAGVEWSVQNGMLQVVDKGSSSGTSIVSLRHDTGLIGSPEPKEDGRKKGYVVQSLLQPKIIPSDSVEIVSRLVKGYFTVDTVEHEGSTFGGDFISTVTAYG